MTESRKPKSGFFDRIVGLFAKPAPVLASPPVQPPAPRRPEPLPGELPDLIIHHSGWERERAIHRIAQLDLVATIPALFVRVNDWVPAVRAAALSTLRQFMVDANANQFISQLPAILHLRRASRADHAVFVCECETFLQRPQHRNAMFAAIGSPQLAVARIAASFIVEHDLADKSALAKGFLDHHDCVIRSRAIALLAELQDDADIMQQAISCKTMPVRRAAFVLTLKRDPANAQALARQFLFDQHIAIRDIAIAHLRSQQTALAATFIEVLDAPPQTSQRLRFAMSGLAALGASSAAPSILPYLKHSQASVRLAAMQCLARLDEQGAPPMLKKGLKDPSPAVAKEACRLIYKLHVTTTCEELLSMALPPAPPHTWRVCLVLSRAANRWDRLAFLFALSREVDTPACRASVAEEVVNWNRYFNQSNEQPAPGAIGDLVVALDNRNFAITPDILHEIKFTLNTYQ